MTKYLVAGAASLVLLTGVAAAQNDALHNDPNNTTSQAASQTVTRSIARPDGTIETTTDTAAKPVNTDGDFHAITTVKRKKANGMVTEETRSFTAGADGTRDDLTFGATTAAGTQVDRKREKKTDLTGQSRTDATTTVRAPE